MAQQTLREMVGHRGLKRGTLLWEFATPGIGHLLAGGGCDFVFVDCEHSGFGIDTLKQVLRYLEAAGVAPIVRPPGKRYDQIANALDVGAGGLILPMVASAEEAERIVAHARYAPAGHRGVALGIGHDRYQAGPVKASLEVANERTVLFALIETADGVAEVDAIAAVDGIDALWVGHLDLSTSLGVPGEFDHPSYVAAVDRIENAARTSGKSLGRIVGSVDEGIEMFRRGYDFIGLGTDSALFQSALRSGLDAIEEGASDG